MGRILHPKLPSARAGQYNQATHLPISWKTPPRIQPTPAPTAPPTFSCAAMGYYVHSVTYLLPLLRMLWNAFDQVRGRSLPGHFRRASR